VAVPRSSLPLILAGTVLFGVLLFLLGLVVGMSLSAPGPAGTAPAGAGAGPPAAAAPAPTPPGGEAPGGAAPAPATASPPPPGQSGDAGAQAAPAITPVKVKGFGYGVPPSSPPASALRGRLLEQASVTPAPAPAADAGPASQPAVPAPAAPEPPPAPLVFSVAVGRFLLEDNAARRSAEVLAKGFQPLVVIADPPDPSGWLTVTLGAYPDAVTAGRLAEDASAQGFETALVSWLAP